MSEVVEGNWQAETEAVTGLHTGYCKEELETVVVACVKGTVLEPWWPDGLGVEAFGS